LDCNLGISVTVVSSDALNEELSAVLGDEGAGDENDDDDDDKNDAVAICDAVLKSLGLIRQVHDAFPLQLFGDTK
jgi:hypothetical protein